MVKLDVDTLSTVPDAPPAAGPDRALDPPPPGPGCPAVAEGDVAHPAEVRSPHTSAQRPRSIHFFCSTAIAVPLAGVPAWPWLPRPTLLAKTLAGEAAQRRRRLNFQQPAALTSRSKRGEREG